MGGGRKSLFGRNPIEHIEDIANRISINVTLDGHVFHPGDVTHRVHFESSNLYYDAVGTGTGSFPIFNTDVGIFLFQPGVETAVDKFGF